MGDGSGLAEAMLGLDGVRVTDVREADGEVTIEVETTEAFAWCERCGCRAESQDRMWVDVRDLECFGRSTRLRIWKRRWRCREPLCSARTWTEPLEFLDTQVVKTPTRTEQRSGVDESIEALPGTLACDAQLGTDETPRQTRSLRRDHRRLHPLLGSTALGRGCAQFLQRRTIDRRDTTFFDRRVELGDQRLHISAGHLTRMLLRRLRHR